MREIKLLLLLLLLAAVAAAQAPAGASAEKDAVRELRRETFLRVWNTVNEKHYDPSFGGVDWTRMREVYEPKAMAAVSDEEFHGVLRRMIGELRLSHFAIIPPGVQFGASVSGDGTVGVRIRWIDGLLLVGRVEPGSPAARSGVRPGFAVTNIDGKPVGDILAPFEKSFAERGVNDRMQRVYRERAVAAMIDGKAGTEVTIGFLDGEDKPVSRTLVREERKRELSQPLGNFPAQEVVFESRRLEGNIGYISFTMWVIPQITKIRAAVREFADARAIIFDLRGNPGGVGGMAPGVAGLLVDRQVSLGTMNGRNMRMNLTAYPQSDPFQGSVVVLTDHGTGSTSELFAAGLQEIGRATVIGGRSAGAVLPSVFEKLPTGAVFQYAISDYRSPKNVLIEGRGVEPDIAVAETRRMLLEGRDAVLEQAVRTINSQTR